MSYFHNIKVYLLLTVIRNEENYYFIVFIIFYTKLQIFENKINVAFIVISLKT